MDSGIQHPNQYFLESQKIINGEVKEKSSLKGVHKVQTIRATLPAKMEKPEASDDAAMLAMDSDEDLSCVDLSNPHC